MKVHIYFWLFFWHPYGQFIWLSWDAPWKSERQSWGCWEGEADWSPLRSCGRWRTSVLTRWPICRLSYFFKEALDFLNDGAVLTIVLANHSRRRHQKTLFLVVAAWKTYILQVVVHRYYYKLSNPFFELLLGIHFVFTYEWVTNFVVGNTRSSLLNLLQELFYYNQTLSKAKKIWNPNQKPWKNRSL